MLQQILQVKPFYFNLPAVTWMTKFLPSNVKVKHHKTNLFCRSWDDHGACLIHGQTVDGVLVSTQWGSCHRKYEHICALSSEIKGFFVHLSNSYSVNKKEACVKSYDKESFSLVTVLLEAVRAVSVFTSHRKICLSSPADATSSLSFAYAKALT